MQKLHPSAQRSELARRAHRVLDFFPPRRLRVPFPKTSSLGNATLPRLGSSAPLSSLECVPIDRAKEKTPYRRNKPSPSSALSATQPRAAPPRPNANTLPLAVSIISNRNLQAFDDNVVAFDEQGHFVKQLQTGTRVMLVVRAQSQPDNIASIPRVECPAFSVPLEKV